MRLPGLPENWLELAKALGVAILIILMLQFGLMPRGTVSPFWVGLTSYFLAGITLAFWLTKDQEKHLANCSLIILSLAWSLHFALRATIINLHVIEDSLPQLLLYNILSGIALVIGAGSRQFVNHMASVLNTLRRFW